MSVSARVAKEGFGPDCDIFSVGRHLFGIDTVKYHGLTQFRVYHAIAEYTSTSGGYTRRGKALRRYDPEAGDEEGKMATFSSLAAAKAWFDKYERPAYTPKEKRKP